MTIICNPVLSKKQNNTHPQRETYGLSISYAHAPHVVIDHIDDVFTNQETAVCFCQLINENAVDELHLRDILEDQFAVI